MSETSMSVGQFERTIDALETAGLRFWVVGGWGIDALVGEHTRPHHDLDLLVAAADLPSLAVWLEAQGFLRAYEWEENEPLLLEGQRWDTAFVECHPDGRELDIHAVHCDQGPVRLATTDPWRLPAEWSSTGRVGQVTVPCVTAAAQRAMHQGYELPTKHQLDLALIKTL